MAKKHGHGADEEMQELNLIPIMALLVILIPVLLFAFTFVQIKIQAVSAPRLGSGQAKKANDEKKPLNLTVLITKDGFMIKKQAELTAQPEPKIFKRQFEGLDHEEYDFPKLYSRLAAIKRQYPNEKTINIGAEMNIPWKTLARTIDCSRVQLEEDAYTEMAKYSNAKPKKVKNAQGIKESVPLFPAVVFVVAE